MYVSLCDSPLGITWSRVKDTMFHLQGDNLELHIVSARSYAKRLRGNCQRHWQLARSGR